MILTISIDKLFNNLSDDEDNSDGLDEQVRLKDENEAQALTLPLFMTMKKQLGVNIAKAIIFKCATGAGIPLSAALKKDSVSVVDSIDIEMLRKKLFLSVT